MSTYIVQTTYTTICNGVLYHADQIIYHHIYYANLTSLFLLNV